MKQLKTSTKILIILAISAIILSIALLITIPEPWMESIKETHSFILDGTRPDYDYGNGQGFHSYHYFNRKYQHHGFGGILFVGLILLFIFKGRRFHGRKNNSRAIVDELYAEEKITLEEYKRRRVVLEEEGN